MNNLSQRLGLRSSNKNVALQNVSIYDTRKDTRKQYKSNKLKIVALTWNNEFELPDASYFASAIQDILNILLKIMKH